MHTSDDRARPLAPSGRPLGAHQQHGSWDGRGVNLPRTVHPTGDVRGAAELSDLLGRSRGEDALFRWVGEWLDGAGSRVTLVPGIPQGGLRVSDLYWRLPRPDARLLGATGRLSHEAPSLCVSSRWYIWIQSGVRRSVQWRNKLNRRCRLDRNPHVRVRGSASQRPNTTTSSSADAQRGTPRPAFPSDGAFHRHIQFSDHGSFP